MIVVDAGFMRMFCGIEKQSSYAKYSTTSYGFMIV
jgi:hypothetical protein